MKLKDLFEDNVNGGGSSNSQFFKTYEETKNWLDKMRVKKYKVNKDALVVDVDGRVDLINKNIKNIPVKFGRVTGWFNIEKNRELTSLIGCPDSVDSVYFYSTGIKNFNGLGSVKRIVASNIESLESFEGLPNELGDLSIDGSCYNIRSLDHFPKIINSYLTIGPDFKWFDTLYKHMELCGGIGLDGEIKNYNGILKLLYIKGVKNIETYDRTSKNAVNILNAEIKRQPDPRKRNLLKVAQELSNAGFHHLTVM